MDSDHPAVITGTCAGDNQSSSCSSLPSCSCDFLLAYNNSSLSDRVLRLEIVDPSSSIDSSDSECSDGRDDRPKENGENSLGASHGNDSNHSEVRSRVVRVETIHISSAILAARSPFFRQLFLNGMAESQQRHATLQISSSEEAAIIELLKFIYGKSLSSTSALALLDILMVADKYEVSSCKWSCCQLLQNLPMTLESALLYLELPSSLSTAKPLLDLTKLAKQFLIDRYKDLTKSSKELMELPLVGIEAVLSSDDLQVISEDAVYDFVMQWALTHCQNIEERRDILATCLIPLVRFPYMSCHKLKMILTSSDLDKKVLSKLVVKALFFKLETPYQKSVLAKEQSSNMGRGYVERSYIHRPIKVVELSLPRRQCVVYFDLKREEFVNSPSGWVRSEAFAWGRQSLYLQSGCAKEKQTSDDTGFGMGLGMLNVGSTSVKVDYEFAAVSKQTPCQYILKYKGTSVIIGGALPIGHLNLFNMPWSSFIAEDSEYFINNVLHLRVEASISD